MNPRLGAAGYGCPAAISGAGSGGAGGFCPLPFAALLSTPEKVSGNKAIKATCTLLIFEARSTLPLFT